MASRDTNTFFSVTTSLISFMKIQIDRHLAADVFCMLKANILFFVFEYCWFRNARQLLLVLTTSDQFHLIVLHNHWLEFWLQDLKIWYLGRLFGLTIFMFAPWVAILIVRECQDYSQYWKIPSFKLMYLHNYRLDSFHQRWQSQTLHFWKRNWLKHYQPWSCIDILTLKLPQSLTIW